MSHEQSSEVGLIFLRCGGASPPAATLNRKIHVAHRRIKISGCIATNLTATEAFGEKRPYNQIYLTNPRLNHTLAKSCIQLNKTYGQLDLISTLFPIPQLYSNY
jgi:hypothetical protein